MICCVFVMQRSVRHFVFWIVMGMVSSPNRSWAWPCAPWVTCPAKWSWPSSCRDWTWMVRHYIRTHTWVHEQQSMHTRKKHRVKLFIKGQVCHCLTCILHVYDVYLWLFLSELKYTVYKIEEEYHFLRERNAHVLYF